MSRVSGDDSGTQFNVWHCRSDVTERRQGVDSHRHLGEPIRGKSSFMSVSGIPNGFFDVEQFASGTAEDTYAH
jgi:hypothetical protein